MELGQSRATHAADQVEMLRTIAESLSTETPIAALWPHLAEPVAALLDAQRVVVALCDDAGRRIAFDSALPDVTTHDDIAPGSLAADVLDRDETIARSGDDGISVGAPIRFGTELLGAVVLLGVRADLTAVPLLESCALYIGVRIHGQGVQEETQRYVKLSLTDALTGIANRRKFDQTLEIEWSRARREGTSLAIVMIDVDYFKAFNDQYGHQAGDLCLRQVAHAMAGCMQRPADLLARYGGEEFAAILPATDVAGATALAERLRSALVHLNVAHSESTLGQVSLSAGVAAARAVDGLTSADLVARADAALYDAKIAGRNRVVSNQYISHTPVAERIIAKATHTNLPLPSAPLVGRALEIADIRALIAAHRLVTVVGTGGIGKTRVALHVAETIGERYADGAWLVDLAKISDPALVTSTIARAFGDRGIGATADRDDLARKLASKTALLIIDNCEHVLAEAATVVATLLLSCPGLTVLATSREPLGIEGEARYRLPLLSLPTAEPALTARDALRSDAVALFAERAGAARPSFVVDDHNASLVASIVRRLDGIPLAIELAAARLEGSGLDLLAARLDQRFRLLSGENPSPLSRQSTMQATLDWSFDLLSDAEQTLLRRLSVFAGPFSIESAELVCAGGRLSAVELADIFLALVRKSLVLEAGVDTATFALLESVRAYGREKLVAAGEADQLARSHACYYADLADRAVASYAAVTTRDWLAAAQRNRPNYRAALEWALGARNDILVGSRLAAAMLSSLGDGETQEAIGWARTALDALEPGVHPSLEAHLHLRLANSERGLTADLLRDVAERAVALYRTLDEPVRFTNALRVLAQVLYWYFPRDHEAARALAEESIVVARTSGDQLSLASALKTRALVLDASALDEKRALMDESLALSRRFGNDLQVGSVLSWMSEMEFVAGDDLERTLGYGRAAMRYAEASGSRMRLEISAANLAMYAAGAGEWNMAIATATRALRLSRESRSAAGITWAIQALASAAAGREDFARAARLLAFCDARCGTLHSPRQANQGEDISARRLRVRLAAAMPPEELSRELHTGSALTEDAAVAEAFALSE
jgi:diguanylate cyclase (GGDEF)-like protein